MVAAALKQKPILKAFHATVHVTRTEPWCIEAEAAEEARELLSASAGYRCEIGDCKYRSRARRGLSFARPDVPRAFCHLNFLDENLDFRRVMSGSYGTRKRKPRSRSRRGVFDAQDRN